MFVVPTAPWAHTAFDMAAWTSGAAVGFGLYRWRLKGATERVAGAVGPGYFASLAIGAVAGGWLAGSLNTLQDAAPALSHSVAGALAGAIVGVEAYKLVRGVRGSTGGIFVGSFTTGIIVGRLGCFFTGLADRTYGTPTRLPWAVDLGDHVGRHPVQLYESVSMAVFLAIYLAGLARRAPWAMRRGFYAMTIAYGAQRFGWEFLKPYPKLVGPLNLFHLLSLGLVVYGWIWWARSLADERRQEIGAVPVLRTDHEPV
jgi:phosphatidylglycerol:prolipoprotein diacylglycerol transferase